MARQCRSLTRRRAVLLVSFRHCAAPRAGACGPGMKRARPAREGRVTPDWGPVPGADLLAGVTAGGPAAGGQGCRDVRGRLQLRFDGVGRQAAGRVQAEGLQGPGGADLQAGGAGSAVLQYPLGGIAGSPCPLCVPSGAPFRGAARVRASDRAEGLIRRKPYGEQQDAQEAPGAVLPGNQEGVLALPAQPRPGRQLTLQKGSRIHADSSLQPRPAGLGSLQQPSQTGLQDHVVIQSPKVPAQLEAPGGRTGHGLGPGIGEEAHEGRAGLGP